MTARRDSTQAQRYEASLPVYNEQGRVPIIQHGHHYLLCMEVLLDQHLETCLHHGSCQLGPDPDGAVLYQPAGAALLPQLMACK